MLLFLAAAHAFSPEIHRAIAARALVLEGGALEAEVLAAAPERAGAASSLLAEARRFPLAAAGEDWNLPRKWGRWHHYFLDTPIAWRAPSAARVAMLDEDLRAALPTANGGGDRDRAWVLAGLLAHHVQDMASPPHVVPVAHGLADGFEDYDVRALIAAAGAEPPPALDPVAAHASLAGATLAALQEPLVCDAGPLPWTRFWEPRPGRFGTLGDLRFGVVPGCEAGTAAFARARIEAAVAYTRAVVRFVMGAGVG